MPHPQKRSSRISRAASEDLGSYPTNAWLGQPSEVRSQVDSNA